MARKDRIRRHLSVWRTNLTHTVDGDELRVVQEIADEVCLAPKLSVPN